MKKLTDDSEVLQKFPLAANRKLGHLPNVHEMLKAYLWRMNGNPTDTVVDTTHFPLVGDESETFRTMFSALLFPLPYGTEIECEIRALIAKVIVADGLWSDFRLGAPFDYYCNDTGKRIYSDDEAIELGQMFRDAVDQVGYVKVMSLMIELLEILLMP